MAWGGFVDGKLNKRLVSNDRGGLVSSFAVFYNRREARRQYEDVRRIEIREVKKP